MVTYREFRVGNLFRIEKTKSCNTNKLTPVFDVKYPYVTRTSLNNGVNDYTGKIEDVAVNEANVFSLGLLGMDFFHQKKEWYAGQFVRKIIPKFNMTDRLALYFKTQLDKQKEELLKVLVRNVDSIFENEMVFKLPATPQGTPDFDFMENYIKEIERKHIKKLESDLDSRTENLLTVIGREDLIGDPDGLAAVVAAGFDDSGVDYAEFRVGDILEVSPTKKLTELGPGYIKDSDIISDDGVTPYIAAVSTNNGISGYSIYEPTNEGGVITVSTTADSSNTLFYQKEPFIGRQQMAQIKHINGDKLNQRVAAYLISLFRRHMSTYNYGTKLRIDNLVEMIILLPVTPQGTPDFDFMAQYIAHIELKHTLSLTQWTNAKESA